MLEKKKNKKCIYQRGGKEDTASEKVERLGLVSKILG
jgi:hypothetical protein